MEFMNGVVLIKEIVTLSIVGSLAFFCAELIVIALAYGGVILHIKGRSYFSAWRRITGLIISFVGICLVMSLMVAYKSDLIISIAEELGLADHTGKYKVAVAADVDMNEFQERYEIIDFKNGVYTIKVKES